ncbi:OB-fold protein [Lysobacter changpingensis]|uniref:OB-fold protein n=1 Tax=Lysobacter changpingensis TaxID=2792784 RepID=UPI001A8C58E0|nr:hypothetical protein [Lysobacter changpingensis]
MRKLLKWIGIIVLALFAIGVVRVMLMSPEERAAEVAKAEASRAERQAEQAAKEAAAAADKTAEAQRVADSLPAITAAEYASAYEENTVAADALYKGKQFKVTGTIEDINTDFMGDPYLTLRGTNEFSSPQFGFSKANLSALGALKRGERVTLICTGKGDIAKTAMSDECSLL